MFKFLRVKPSDSARSLVADPFAEVRALKWWARLSVYTTIAAFTPVDRFVIGMSWPEVAFIQAASFGVATGAIEMIFRQSLKLRKRSAYPAIMLVEAGTAQSVAAGGAAMLAVLNRLLRVRAILLLTGSPGDWKPLASLGWEEGDTPELTRLLEDELRECHLTQNPLVDAPAHRLLDAGWFLGSEVLTLTPLVAFDSSIGVAIIVAPRDRAETKDIELLRGLGTATGVALENLHQKEVIQAKEERLRAVVTAAPVVLLRTDSAGAFTLLEGQALERLGLSERLVGRSVFEVFAEAPGVSADFGRALNGETVKTVVDLGETIFEGELCPMLDAEGRVTGVIGVATDVTERRHAENLIRHMAYHDSLTGLPNREMFERTLAAGVSEAKRCGSALAVLFIDLDGFKEVNDSLGHAAGDALLKEVAGDLKRLAPEESLVARIGGDEFLVLLPRIAGPEEATQVSGRILSGLSREWQAVPDQFRVGASIGVAVFPHDGRDGAALVRSADRAMYEAKTQGKGRYALLSGPRS